MALRTHNFTMLEKIISFYQLEDIDPKIVEASSLAHYLHDVKEKLNENSTIEISEFLSECNNEYEAFLIVLELALVSKNPEQIENLRNLAKERLEKFPQKSPLFESLLEMFGVLLQNGKSLQFFGEEINDSPIDPKSLSEMISKSFQMNEKIEALKNEKEGSQTNSSLFESISEIFIDQNQPWNPVNDQQKERSDYFGVFLKYVCSLANLLKGTTLE